MNLIIITSVINISNNPLSYTRTRSVYTPDERFQQTLKTIESLNKIPNSEILLIDNSNISKEKENLLKSKINYYINNHIKEVDGLYKGVGEASQIIKSLNSIDLSKYENIFKISGRYWLNNDFNFELFDNNQNVFFEPMDNIHAVSTVFYKIHKGYIDLYEKTLKHCIDTKGMIEVEFKTLFNNKYKTINNLGVVGYVSVDGVFWEGKK